MSVLHLGVETDLPVPDLIDASLELLMRLDKNYPSAEEDRLELVVCMHALRKTARKWSSLRNVEDKLKTFFADFPIGSKEFPKGSGVGAGVSVTYVKGGDVASDAPRFHLSLSDMGHRRDCVLGLALTPESAEIEEAMRSFLWLATNTAAYVGMLGESYCSPNLMWQNSQEVYGLVSSVEIIAESSPLSTSYDSPRGRRFVFLSQIPFSQLSFVQAPQVRWHAPDVPEVVQRFSRKDLRPPEDNARLPGRTLAAEDG